MIATATYDSWVGLGIALAAVVYLVIVFIFPDRF